MVVMSLIAGELLAAELATERQRLEILMTIVSFD